MEHELLLHVQWYNIPTSGLETCLMTSRTSTVGISTIFSLHDYVQRQRIRYCMKMKIHPWKVKIHNATLKLHVLVNYLWYFNLRFAHSCWDNQNPLGIVKVYNGKGSTNFYTYWISSFSTCQSQSLKWRVCVCVTSCSTGMATLFVSISYRNL